jgi:formylglycine-generating enzyme required for sulfatase activity
MYIAKQAKDFVDKRFRRLLLAGLFGVTSVAVIAVSFWFFFEHKARETKLRDSSAKWRETVLKTPSGLNYGYSGDTLQVPLPSGIILSVAYCPPGEFLMGSPEDEEGRQDDETQHNVTLTKGFWLGIHEITQGQWNAIMRGSLLTFNGSDELPVKGVEWNRAQLFVRRLNESCELPSGWEFSLPTEAQWEYACRAGTGGPYAGEIDAFAWYAGNSGGMVHEVGEKQPNAWGFYDMHGNVLEWCKDRYGPYPPDSASGPINPNLSPAYVCRGGSWNDAASKCRSAHRERWGKAYPAPNLGFRVALISTQ